MKTISENTIIASNSETAKWRLRKISTVSVLIWMALAIELYLLLYDIPFLNSPVDLSTDKLSLAPIAELVSSKNIVRVQPPGDLVWNETRNGQTLYRRESVLTLDKSKADIAFLDGTGIVMDENSLIVLEKTPSDESLGYQKLILTLLHGTIHKGTPRGQSEILRRENATTPTFEIRIGKTIAPVTPETELTVAVSPESPDTSMIRVSSGQLKLQTSQGEVVVKKGEEAEVSKDENTLPQVRKTQFELLSPAPDDLITLEKDQQIKFRWNVGEGSGFGVPLELEVSTDPQFKSSVQRIDIPSTEPPLRYFETKMKFGPHAKSVGYFWRVRSLAFGRNGPAMSETQQFWIEPTEKPGLIFPENGMIAKPGSSVVFSWDDMTGATGYEMEIQGRPTQQISKPFAKVENLTDGEINWRVRARLGGGKSSSWSDYRKLIVAIPPAEVTPASLPAPAPQPAISVAPKPIEPPPPPSELSEPEFQKEEPQPKQSWLNWFVHSAFADEADPVIWKIRLKWKPVEKASRYKIQIGKERSFNTIIAEAETGDSEWTWRYKVGMENSKGRVFYRVASINDTGQTGKYSASKPIKIPKYVLAKARALKPEVYKAIDASQGQGVPTDAEESGNLDTLAAKPAPKIASPSVVPSPVPAAPVPIAPIAPVAATSATPAALSGQRVEFPTARKVVKELLWSGELDTGFGNFSQNSSDPSLGSVKMQTPYFQQKIGIAAQLTKIENAVEIPDWTFQFQFQMASFQKPDGLPTTVQPTEKGYGFRLNALDWAKDSEYWSLGVGITLDRAFRWVKIGPQSVSPDGSASLGPLVSTVRNYDHRWGVSLTSWGLSLGFPATGILTGGYFAAEGNTWLELQLIRFKRDWIGILLQAEVDYAHWSGSTAPNTLGWTAWLGPTFHFGSSGSARPLLP